MAQSQPLRLGTAIYVDGEARDRARDSLTSLITNDIGELSVDVDIDLVDTTPVVSLSGPDETAARNVLRDRWGERTVPADGEVGVGTLESWDEEGFVLNAGESVHIPAHNLGLGAGSPGEIRQRFGLVQHLPMQFVAGDPPRLADAERDRCFEWRRGAGRVNVNSATRAEVRATVNRAGHADDIVTVERLGLLEQSIVCAPDTDPPGLLASVGGYLPAELLCVVP